MDSPSSTSNAPAWQAALDPRLTRRLMRPLQRSGMIGTRLASSVVSRLQRMAGGFPLLPRLSQRWSSSEASAAGQPPIVYAQPALPSGEAVAAVPAAGRMTVDGGRWTDEGPLRGMKDESHHLSSHIVRPMKRSSATRSDSPLSAAQSVPSSREAIVRPPSREAVPQSSPPPSVTQSDSSSVNRPPSSVSSSALPVVHPRRVNGSVLQRKPISTPPPSVSKKTADNVPRKAAQRGPTLPEAAIPSTSSEESSSLPSVYPRPSSVSGHSLEHETVGEPALNLASPAPAQRIVVRPLRALPASPAQTYRVQRVLHQPSVSASPPPGGLSASPALPVSTRPTHFSSEPVPEPRNDVQPIAPLAVHRTSSATPVIQRQAASAERKSEAAVIQRSPQRGGGGGSPDLDELAEKVQAKLAHWLSIESERRGLTRWD